jgi:hypothetical protein
MKWDEIPETVKFSDIPETDGPDVSTFDTFEPETQDKIRDTLFFSEISGDDPNEVFDYVDEIKNEAKKKTGFFGGIAEKPLEKLPFVGAMASIDNITAVTEAIRRLNNYGDDETLWKADRDDKIRNWQLSMIGNPYAQYMRPTSYTFGGTRESDIKIVEKYLEEAGREYSFLGRVGQLTSEMPSFMIEFLATGGLKSIGSKTAKEFGEKLLKEKAKTYTGRALLSTGGWVSGSAARTVGMPHRIAEAIVNRRVPTDIKIEDGKVEFTETDEPVYTSIMKGVGDVFIENLSEDAGQYMPKLPFIGKVTEKLKKRWMSLVPGRTALEFMNNMATKAGYHGILGEVGEEYLGSILRASVDIEDFGAGEDASFEERLTAAIETDIKTTPEMLVSFAVPGGVKYLASLAISEINKKTETKSTEAPTIDEQAKPSETPSEVIPQEQGQVTQETKSESKAVETKVGAVESKGGIKVYKGKAYRVETGSEYKPEAKTAADVIRYEQEELGNSDINISPEKLAELEKRPATDIIWVTRKSEDAAKYGQEELSDEVTDKDLEGVTDYTDIVKDGEIIAEIGDDGVLVLKPQTQPTPSAKKQEVPAVKENLTTDENVNILQNELNPEEKATIAQLEAETAEKPKYEVKRVDVKTSKLGHPVANYVIYETETGKEVSTFDKRKKAYDKLSELEKEGEPLKGTKRTPGILNVKATVQKVVDEYKALTAGIKKAAQAGRIAYTLGKSEGIEQVKDYYREMRARKKAVKELRNRIKDAKKIIQDTTAENVDWTYAAAVEAIKYHIDDSFRKSSKRAKRVVNYLKNFAELNPEKTKDVPIDFIQKMGKKKFQDYTVEELEQVAEIIDNLRKKGKEVRETEKAARKEKRQADIDAMVVNLNENKPIEDVEVSVDENGKPVEVKGTYTGEKTSVKKTYKKVRFYTLAPQFVFNMVEGWKHDFGGSFFRTFYDRVIDSRANEDRITTSRKKFYRDNIAEKYGVSEWDLVQPFTIEGIKKPITKDQMIGIYMHNQNPLQKAHLVHGNNINEETIQRVIGLLSKNEKAYGDALIDEYASHKPRFRRSVIEQENRDMGDEERYSPMRVEGVVYENTDDEIKALLENRNATMRAYLEHGMSIERKNIPPEYQKPIDLHATQIWFESIILQEHYINMGPTIRELQNILKNKTFSDSLKRVGGDTLTKYMQNYLNNIASNRMYATKNGFDRALKTIRQNVGIAYICARISTVLKQFPSVLMYLPRTGVGHLTQSMVEFGTNPLEVIEKIKEKDPTFGEAFERELAEMQYMPKTRKDYVKREIRKKGMFGSGLFDMMAKAIGWNAMYEKNKTLKGEYEAIRLARDFTYRTQPSTIPENQAQIYRLGAVYDLFTMFTRQLNLIYGNITSEIPAFVSNKEYYKAMLGIMAFGLTALTEWIITNGRLPEDDEDVIDVVADQSLQMMPIVGKYMASARDGYSYSDIPGSIVPEAIGIIEKRIEKTLMEGENQFTESDIKKIIEAIAVSTGMIPYSQLKSAYQAAEEQDAMKLITSAKPKKTKKDTKGKLTLGD